MTQVELENETFRFWVLSRAWRGDEELAKGLNYSDIMKAFKQLEGIPGKHIGHQASDALNLVIHGKRRRKAIRRSKNVVSIQAHIANKTRKEMQRQIASCR